MPLGAICYWLPDACLLKAYPLRVPPYSRAPYCRAVSFTTSVIAQIIN